MSCLRICHDGCKDSFPLLGDPRSEKEELRKALETGVAELRERWSCWAPKLVLAPSGALDRQVEQAAPSEDQVRRRPAWEILSNQQASRKWLEHVGTCQAQRCFRCTSA